MEWLERKPCWLGERGRELNSGCRRRSKNLTTGQRKEIGRQLVPKSTCLPGLRTGVVNFGNIAVVDREVRKVYHRINLLEFDQW